MNSHGRNRFPDQVYLYLYHREEEVVEDLRRDEYRNRKTLCLIFEPGRPRGRRTFCSSVTSLGCSASSISFLQLRLCPALFETQLRRVTIVFPAASLYAVMFVCTSSTVHASASFTTFCLIILCSFVC